MKIKLLSCLFFLMISQLTSAQFGSGKLEDVQAVQKAPLLVVLQAKNDKVLKKITKKDGDEAAQKYLTNIETTNASLKNGITASWLYTSDITFITEAELDKYDTKSNKNKYAILTAGRELGDNGYSMLQSKGLLTTYNYGIYLTGKRKRVYGMLTRSSQLTEGDIVFMSQQIQNYLNARLDLKSGKMSRKEMTADLNENAAIIADKTLWIAEEDLKKDFVKKIKKMYPYQLKVTTKEAIDAEIINKKSDICYLRIVPVGQQTAGGGGPLKTSKLIYVQYVLDAEDGKILAYVTPSVGGSLLSGLGGALGNALTKGNGQMGKGDMENVLKSVKKAK